jgi:dolichol-phosphate mannosyltransferase
MESVFLSIVVPCFNEADSLERLHQRISAACAACVSAPRSWELVLVNDGSTDRSFDIMLALAARDARIVAINLARNYGHQIALTAGLRHCRGERILIIDGDLQDPPELLGEMMQSMDANNADVVYGQRRKRAGETRFKTLTAALFYRLLRGLGDVDIPLDAGDFRLMNRRTVEVLNSMPERHRFIRGMVAWIGLRQVPVLYDREERFAGATGYSLWKMLLLALDAITSFSIMPLRIASLVGSIAGLFGLLGLFYTLGSWWFGSVVQGWTSVASVVLVIGGAQLMLLGVFGEYLGRLYLETKRRPLFVVDRIVAGGSDPALKLVPNATAAQIASGQER